MRTFILVILFLFGSEGLVAAEKDKKICLNMIVKNESKVIERCLRSVIPLIDYWVIVDTGSTDGTQEIIQKLMKDVPGKLYERPWVNFAHNRNEALQLAKNKGDYLLFIDADEELKYGGNFSFQSADKDCYVFQVDFNEISYTRVQLVNNHLNWKWEGVLHETIHSPQSKSNGKMDGIVNIVRNEGCRSQDPDIFLKDARILEEALLNEPNNSRYMFYLALSYNNAKNYAKALENFQKRAAMGGCEQEVFWSKYCIGRMQEFLNYDTETITKSYCDAYVFRPIRTEPLFRLAQMYRKGENHFLSSVFSAMGLSNPLPKNEGIIERWIYEYGLLVEYASSAFALGKYKECLESFDLLLSKPTISQGLRKSIEEDKQLVLAKMPLRLELKNESVR